MSKKELINIVKNFNKVQVKFTISGFEMIGFYREDKRQKKSFLINCIENCYNDNTDTLDNAEIRQQILLTLNYCK